MMSELCQLPQWQNAIIITVAQLSYMLIEAWLGKTEKVQSASVLELVFNILKRILRIGK